MHEGVFSGQQNGYALKVRERGEKNGRGVPRPWTLAEFAKETPFR
jgi:hypothetical protein